MNNKIAILEKRLLDFYYKSRYYSIAFALWDLVWWICFYLRPPLSWKLSTYAIKQKTAWLDHYIEKRYQTIIQSFEQLSKETIGVNKGCRRIWVFWGQGEDQMPVLVRACYKQLISLNGDVVLVTKENVHDYVDIPAAIYQKVESGKLTWANFSDIVRTTLLAQHGGLWLDATVWITRPFPFDDFKTMPFYSVNGKVPVNNKSVRFWTSFEWNWSSWAMLANKSGHPLFKFVSQMMQAIAIKESYWPDYVLQDFLIYYACRRFPQIGEAMTTCNEIEFKNRGTLASLMNSPYNEEEYKKLNTTDYIFKLSYRTLWQVTTPDNHTTYYGKLIAKL